MTLIAQLTVNGAPLLVADVLVSADGRTGLRVNLPLVGDINERIAGRGLPFEVVRFEQKINLLNGRLVVAWCGPIVQAERAIQVLAGISSREDLTLDDIGHELMAIDQTRINNLQLVGLLLGEVKGDAVRASLFRLGVLPTEIKTLGPVYAAGSGRNDFLRFIDKTDWSKSATGNEFQVAHALLGGLVNEELRTGNTIANRWGGGFEAVTFSKEAGGFQKVGDILHTFWSVNAESLAMQFRPMFYKTTYWRDALIIRYARFDEISPRTFKLSVNDLELVPPLLRRAEDYDLAALGPVDFSYKALCCHVAIEKANSRDLMIFVEHRAPAREVALQFDGSSDRLEISGDLQRDIIQEVSASISA